LSSVVECLITQPTVMSSEKNVAVTLKQKSPRVKVNSRRF